MENKPHTLIWEPEPKEVRVVLNGATVAETSEAHVLREGKLPPVHYVPLKDIRSEYLERTDHSTTCPFKGDASYWSIVVGDRREENVLWAYEEPIEDAAFLKGYAAFYTDRVDEFQLLSPTAAKPTTG